MKRTLITMFVLGVAVTLSIAAGQQITTGGGLQRVVLDSDSHQLLTGSGTSGNPLLGRLYTGTGIGGTGSAGDPITSTASGGVPTTRQINSGTGLSGGGDLSADRTLSITNTGVTANTYTYATLTVNAQGQLTAASNGAAPAPASRTLTAGTGLTGGGDLTADRSFALADTAVTPGSYTATNLTVDAQGRITSASSGSFVPTSRQVIAGTGLTGGGDLSTDRTLSFATIADQTILGNNTGGAAAPIALTASQLTAMIDTSVTRRGLYGDGNDGDMVMDGTNTNACVTLASNVYTATRECMFGNLTINSGKTFLPAGYPVHVHGTLTNNGKIHSNGGDAVLTTAGAAPWSGTHILPNGTAGGSSNGGVGTSSASAPQDFSTTAANGGASGGTPGTGTSGGTGHGAGGGGSVGQAGGNGGGNTLITSAAYFRRYDAATTGRSLGASFALFTVGSSGGGGGTGSGTANGGAGGGSGGWLVVHAAVCASGSGTIESKGGAGGNGATPAAPGNGSGGGGGGGGGVLVLDCGSGVTQTTSVSGGSAGTGGAGNAGTAGANGGSGGNGVTVIY